MLILHGCLVLLLCTLSRGVLGGNNQASPDESFPGQLYRTDGLGPEPSPPFVSMDYADSDDVTTSELGAPPLGEVLWMAIPFQGRNEDEEEEEDEINGEEARSPAAEEGLETNLARRKRSLEEDHETNPEAARPKRNSQPKSKPTTRWVPVRRSSFVPRLGKRADEETQNMDWTAYSGDQDSQLMAAEEVENAEAPSGDRYLRRSSSFSPRLGRASFAPRLGRASFAPRLGRSDPELEASSDLPVPLDDEEVSISTRASSFSPRLGKKAYFVPRLGKRGRSFSPRLGKRGRSFSPRLGKRGRSFTPRLGKRDYSFVPRLGKRGSSRTFSPRLGRSSFAPRLGRSDPDMSALQWST